MTASEPLGVLHLIDSLAAGGAERVAVEIVRRLPRDRFRPFLCASRGDGPLGALVPAHVERLDLGRRGRFDLRAPWRLARALRRQRIAIVHAHSTSLFLAAAANLLAPGARVVWHDHCGAHGDAERAAYLYGPAARRAAAVIAVSRPLADWARHRLGIPAERITYLPNFAPRSSGAEETDGAAGAGTSVADLPGTPATRVVAVANLRPQKDHLNLMAAWEGVASQRPDAHLLLVGDGTDPAWISRLRQEVEERHLGDRVHFLGRRDDVPAILAAAAVGVLSSSSEGLPLALLEYGASGLPAVATDVGQCAEVLDDGRAGLLVPPSDPDALGRALLALLESSERRRDLGDHLRRRVETAYNAEVTMDTLTTLYERLAR